MYLCCNSCYYLVYVSLLKIMLSTHFNNNINIMLDFFNNFLLKSDLNGSLKFHI